MSESGMLRARCLMYSYCSAWPRWDKRPIDMLDPHAARLLHEDRRPYTVLAGGASNPVAIVGLRGADIAVAFLDGRFREYLSYQYEERAPGRLFLASATYRSFRGNSIATELVESYQFSEAGAVHFSKEHFQEGLLASSAATMELSDHWDRYPDFDDYESLLSLDWVRKLSAI